MGLNLDDYQNENTWITGVRRIQVSEAGPVRTSGSTPRATGTSTLTTYTLADALQGRALYKPKAQTLDIFNQALSKDFEGLRTEKYFVEDKALSPYDVFTGVPNTDPEEAIGIGTPTAPASGTPAVSGVPPGQLYFMGDSLTYGLTLGGISDKLNAKGYSPNKVNFDGGRSISGAGSQVHRSGFEAIADDAAFIKDSKHIVIALGTNHENNFAGNIDTLYDAIKQINSNAPIYWVDVAASGISKAFGQDANKAIYAKAQSSGMTIISQFKFLWGEDKDPQAYDISGPDPQGLLGTADLIHYNGGAAYGKYADFIVGKLPSAPAPVPTGGDNKTRIWNFFIAKGMQPFQVAGMMGNMQAESGFNPKASYPSTTAEAPGPTAYGIVQWYPGTKILPAANAMHMNPNDLEFQMAHLWEELSAGGDESAAGRALFASGNIRDATIAFEMQFERHGGDPMPERVTNAKAIYKEFTGQDG